jgi:4-methylaminobutanoate oxidase (formaldehyde-forming)
VSPALPSRTRVVVIGGGVIGTSIAYHLAHAGERDVVLLERDRLTSGTTWHAAGLMTCFGSFSETSTRMRLYSRDLYARLEAETGLSTGFRPVGLVEAAADTGRLEEYRRVATFQRHLGLEVEEVSPAEMQELFPHARVEDLVGGFHVPGDGRVNPVDLTMSLAKGARMQGVRLVEGVTVQDVLTRREGAIERAVGVRTDHGDIECEVVVNAAGMWARELGARQGLVVPNQAAEHYYLITDTIEGLDPDGPVFEDPASYGYYREEGGGMMVGLFEPEAAAWQLDGIPRDSRFRTLPPDWDRMAPFLEKAMDRVPITHEVGIRTFFCGPESFTPDLAPVVGESPSVAGYFVCAGLNSVGILSGGGLGRIMAHWITTGLPDVDVTGFAATRTQPQQLGRAHRAARTAEVLGTVYSAHPPAKQLRSARNVRRSVVHDDLARRGAAFTDVSGWESPAVYATGELTAGWGRQPWWDRWEAEHRAVREGVGLLDMSFMSKFLVEGPDAGAVLDRVSAGAVDGEVGRITYTQWLNADGRIEADLTVTKLADDSYLVVSSDTAHGSSLAHLRRAIGGSRAHGFDATSAYSMFSLQGPRSRDVLAAVTSADVSDEAFAFRDARWVDLGLARALAVRITYVGELGWALCGPTDMAAHAYETIMAVGADHGIEPVGLRALSSLRLEKGYRDFGHDIDNTDCVIEAGLGFAVALDKDADFVGRAAVTARKAAGIPAQRLVSVHVRGDAQLVHGETVLRDGSVVGYVRAGSQGWTVGGAIGLALVANADGDPADKAWLDAGDWAVDIAGTTHSASVSLRPLYDPANERVRG